MTMEYIKHAPLKTENAMRPSFTLRCAGGALVLTSTVVGETLAQTNCNHLVGKKITLQGDVTSSQSIVIFAPLEKETGYDFISVQSTNPACGKIQTVSNLRTCWTGARFEATGHLNSSQATRSGGSTNPKAHDYAFKPDRDEGLCK
jgi:hypothetical protein